MFLDNRYRLFPDFTATDRGLRLHYTGEKYRKVLIGKVVVLGVKVGKNRQNVKMSTPRV